MFNYAQLINDDDSLTQADRQISIPNKVIEIKGNVNLLLMVSFVEIDSNYVKLKWNHLYELGEYIASGILKLRHLLL